MVFAQQAQAPFKVQVLPTLFFIDREGRVIDSVASAQSESSLRRRIEAALAKR